MAVKIGANRGAAKQLKWHQLLLLRVLSSLLGLWWRTLRFRWGAEVQAIMDAPQPPSVVILWHNRLFVAPAFFRRYFRSRQLAVLISASGDGAWLAAFMEQIGMRPVRGSRYNRGPQAMRELMEANEAGCDVGVTPDGSRGPIYDMKPGAVAVALKTDTPIMLLSFNFGKAWRLKSWDRFYLPLPFTRVEVKIDAVGRPSALGFEDPKAAASVLKARLDAITEDDEFAGEV